VSEFYKLQSDYREQSGLSLQALGDRLGVSKGYLKQIETTPKHYGGNPPTYKMTRKLADVFELKPRERTNFYLQAFLGRLDKENKKFMRFIQVKV